MLAFDHVGRDIKEVAGSEALNYKGCLRCQQVTGEFFLRSSIIKLALVVQTPPPMPLEPLISADQLRAWKQKEGGRASAVQLILIFILSAGGLEAERRARLT